METITKSYALITGGSEGIGFELAKLFANDGYSLILVARSPELLDKAAEEIRSTYPVQIVTIAKDLFDPAASRELYDEVKRQQLIVDILVNDAGQGQYGLFLENDLQRYMDIIQLNVNALTALTYYFLKEMVVSNRGKILQLGSIASQLPGPWQAVYHATKAYVLSFTEALRQEVKDSNVTLTVLQPGATDTDFFNKAEMNESKILDTKLSDPAQVAKDGYEALMNGDDKVISGMKNKMMVGMSNVLPEETVAKQMDKMQEPRNKHDH